MSLEIVELERRLSNLLKMGTIAELDEPAGRVRVTIGENTTGWLPFFVRRAGEDREAWHPEPGEQVMVLSPMGELAQGVVLAGVASDANPPPATVKTTHKIIYKDGAYLQYKRDTHEWQLDVPAAGKITLHVGGTTLLLENSKATLTTPEFKVDSPTSTMTGNLRVDGNVGVGGTIDAAGEISSGPIGLQAHKHTEMGDGAPTSPSIP